MLGITPISTLIDPYQFLAGSTIFKNVNKWVIYLRYDLLASWFLCVFPFPSSFFIFSNKYQFLLGACKHTNSASFQYPYHI